MKKILTSSIAMVALAASASATITVITDGQDSNNVEYGGTFYTSIAANTGDYIVIAHANNKGSNVTITAESPGLTWTAISAPSAATTGRNGSHLFYAEVVTTGSYDIILDDGSQSTVAEATNLWVLRADAGQTISISSQDTNVTDPAQNQSLNLGPTEGYGIAVFGSGNAITDTTSGTAGWTEVQNGADKRIIYSNASASNGLSVSTTNDASPMTGAGAIFTTVPEPTSAALLGLGGLALIFRRRK